MEVTSKLPRSRPQILRTGFTKHCIPTSDSHPFDGSQAINNPTLLDRTMPPLQCSRGTLGGGVVNYLPCGKETLASGEWEMATRGAFPMQSCQQSLSGALKKCLENDTIRTI
jgi:hypothetical protein